MISKRGFNSVDKWVKILAELGIWYQGHLSQKLVEGIKGPWGHNPGGEMHNKEGLGKQCEILGFGTLL